tara:strand:- start:339 stop:1196 length:858 start_codon:yes stop_codon:yes gene_type:complete
MVLESLFNPFTVKKRPWEMFFIGFLYSWIALFISYLVFRQFSGLLMIFFIIFASLPLLYNVIKHEEEIDLKFESEWKILKEHSKVIIFLLYFFLGILIGLVLAYVFLPTEMVESIFHIQSSAIQDINNSVSGGITSFSLFKAIFLNNLKVLFFCLVFSFLYGMGAIFILTWNASVVATAIGNLIKSKLALLSSGFGLSTAASYFSITTFSFMRYMTHGIVEIAAYFVAGLAGSIISVAVIRHNLENERVLYDSLDLVFISLGILLFAALVEVYITPALFSSYYGV